jgi:16S rRNA (cytosine1402-N4)-methyltransferase
MEWLDPPAAGTILETTAGLGGHTALLAQRLQSGSGRVIACDRDAESLEICRRNTEAWAGRIEYVQARFSDLEQVLSARGVGPVDSCLADLGVSRYQLTTAERGFSLSTVGPLDMRMDRTQEQTAADLVNFTAERPLAEMLRQLGEERRAGRIARAIVRARPIRDTGHLARVVEQAAPRTGRLHPATQTFMALRMAVNREQEELDALLESLPRLVRSGGRVVVLTFMSLEDRKVKHAFQAAARAGRAEILTRHVVRPRAGEIERNPASRSAKLRALRMR